MYIALNARYVRARKSNIKGRCTNVRKIPQRQRKEADFASKFQAFFAQILPQIQGTLWDVPRILLLALSRRINQTFVCRPSMIRTPFSRTSSVKPCWLPRGIVYYCVDVPTCSANINQQ